MEQIRIGKYRIQTYGHFANIKILKPFLREELTDLVAGLSSHYHVLVGVYNMMAEHCVRECISLMKQKGLYKQRVKQKAHATQEIINDWVNYMRLEVMVEKYDAYEAVLLDRLSASLKDLEVLRFQLLQWLTMNGYKNADALSWVSLTAMILAASESAINNLNTVNAEKHGIYFGDMFCHMSLLAAHSCWRDVNSILIGNIGDKLSEYQPVVDAFKILAQRCVDQMELTKSIVDSVDEFADVFNDGEKERCEAEYNELKEEQANKEAQKRKHTEELQKKWQEQRERAKPKGVTDEDIQALKEKFGC